MKKNYHVTYITFPPAVGNIAQNYTRLPVSIVSSYLVTIVDFVQPNIQSLANAKTTSKRVPLAAAAAAAAAGRSARAVEYIQPLEQMTEMQPIGGFHPPATYDDLGTTVVL
jgi:hypothetical protein